MKTTLSLWLFAFLTIAATATNPTKIKLLNTDNGSTTIEFIPGDFAFVNVTTPHGEAKTISLDQGTPLLELGAPDLQKLVASVIIPDKAEMELTIISSNFYDLTNIEIAPSKGNLKRTIDPNDVNYTYGQTYTQNNFFPSSIATLTTPYIIRDYRGQTVSLCPFQYNPQTKVLRVYTTIVVAVTVKNATGGENSFERVNMETITDNEFDAVYNRHFINYAATTQSLRYTSVSENGSMLIICHDAFSSDMQPFVTWKNKKGISTALVLKSVAGANSAAIKSYISTYYSTHPTLKYVLLVGDAAQVPSSTTAAGDSDNNYGYLTGNDSYPELLIGRFPATTSTQVQTMVNRTIRYEQTPQSTGTWYKKGITIGSSQGPGDDNEMDYQHQRNLRNQLLAYTYNNITENYDGSQGGIDASGNPTASSIGSQINNGVGIITYTGHGTSSSFYSSGYSSSHIPSLTNTTMHPFIWSVACVNGDFVNNASCFAETWLRAGTPTAPTGALATFMSTINQSWNPPMDGQDEMVNILAESSSNNIKRTFSGISMNGCMKMNASYGSAGREMTDTWTTFGDPSVMVFTTTPTPMVTTHAANVSVGVTSITVSCNVSNALICLSRNGVILGTGTASGGSAIITIPAATVGVIDVVATAFNKMPYSGTINVSGSVGINENAANYNFTSYPNPATNSLAVSFVTIASEKIKLALYNELGQMVMNVVDQEVLLGTSNRTIDVSGLPAGIYFLKLESESAVITKRVVLQK